MAEGKGLYDWDEAYKEGLRVLAKFYYGHSDGYRHVHLRIH